MIQLYIQTILEAAGVKWNSGYMVCPKCGERKLTASQDPAKVIATCWSCHATFKPRGTTSRSRRGWGSVLIDHIWEQCKARLEASPAMGWLVETRKLPNNAVWLTNRDIGAVPSYIDIESAVHKARERLREERDAAMSSAADDPKTLKGTAAVWEYESKQLDEFVTKTLPLIADRQWRDAVVMLRRDAYGDATSLNVRQWQGESADRKEKKIMTLQPIRGHRGVYGAKMDAGYSWDLAIPGNSIRPVIVEGEFNWLSILAQAQKWSGANDYCYFVPGFAVGGKNGADISTITKLLDGEVPIVIYDNDTVDWDSFDRPMPRGYSLVVALQKVTALFATTTTATKGAISCSVKDCDDWMKQDDPTTVAYDTLLAQADYLPRPFEDVKAEIDRVTGEKDKERFKSRQITDIVIEDMEQRGTFHNCSYGVFLTEENSRNQLIEVRKGSKSFVNYLDKYGLGPKESYSDAIGIAIGAKLEDPSFATKNELHSLYARKNGYLYLNQYDGFLVRIAPNGLIERGLNGHDDVLFAANADHVTPWTCNVAKAQLIAANPGLKHQDGSLLDKYILDSIRYDPEHLAVCTAKQLLRTWIMSLFFRDLVGTRIFPVIEGPPGAGKTSFADNLGRLVVGESFGSLSMPTSGDKLAEQMMGVPLVSFEEWDTSTKSGKEVERRLKTLATSPWELRRELYTTADMVRLLCDAAAIISTNSIPGSTEALTQRMLMINTLPRQTSQYEKAYKSQGAKLIPEFMKHRDEIWTELVGNLASINRTVKQMPILDVSLRMADFGSFMASIASVEGWGPEAHAMLDEMQHRQTEQAVGSSRIIGLIRERFALTAAYSGYEATAKAWAEILLSHVADNDLESKKQMTSKYLTWAFTKLQTIKDTFKVTSRWDSHQKVNLFTLHAEEGVVAKDTAAKASLAMFGEFAA
ncbi:MAG: primase-helicase family protein [Terracidiphilus sp.]